jgi:hypothetical protein
MSYTEPQGDCLSLWRILQPLGLPDRLRVTYELLLALAHTFDGQRTPPMTRRMLAEKRGIGLRGVDEHLAALRERGLICCDPSYRGCCLVIYPLHAADLASAEPQAAPAANPTVAAQYLAVPAHNPAVAAHNPAVAAHNPAVAAHNPAVAAHNPAVAAHNPAVAGHNPAVAGHNPAVAGHNPTVAGHNPTVAGHNPTVAGHNPAVAAHNLARPEQDLARPEQDLARPGQDLARPGQDLATPEQDLATPEQDLATPEQDLPPCGGKGADRSRSRLDKNLSDLESERNLSDLESESISSRPPGRGEDSPAGEVGSQVIPLWARKRPGAPLRAWSQAAARGP